jgi:L-rhamnose mutarotase
MIRKAFLMKLKPGCQAEYQKRHNPIWPELQAVLRQHGAHNYSIFLDSVTDNLFAYVEVESEELWTQIATTAECRRWWSYMKELMLTNADDSPVAVTLNQVFYLP